MPNEIKLTRTERFIIANQLRIRAGQANAADAEHWRRMAEALERGYTCFYGEVFQSILAELSEDDCAFVYEVMDMYSMMQHSLKRLKDKGGLSAADLIFPGFDQNDTKESDYMQLAQFIRSGNGFSTLQVKATDFNSHMPRAAQYREMLKRYKRPTTDDLMSLAEIRHVLGR